jgi:uncharacterized protein (TIGR02217 family)
MAFLEIEFPRTIGYKAVGGPGFSTLVNQGLSGAEQRNQNWQYSRGEWRISLMTPNAFQGNRYGFIQLLINFFDNVAGRAYGFRFYDHLDHIAKAQPLIGVPGGVQLGITRTIGSRSYVQLISKPITGAVQDYTGAFLQNTVFQAGTGTPVTVDPTTGLVTGLGAGSLVDFEFDYPVRFDVDKLPLTAEPSAVGAGNPVITMNSVPIIEVAPPNF